MIPKATWMSLNFETRLHVKHSHLKLFVKKKVKEIKPKRMLGILMPLGGQQNLTRGTNLGDNSYGTQVEYLRG
jgi:hypothetical protein